MRTGAILSGALHGGFILLALFGTDWLSAPKQPPLSLTEVTLIDGTRFDAAVSTAPVVANEGPAEMAPPAPEDAAPVAQDRPAEVVPQVAPAQAQAPAARPDVPVLASPPPPTTVPTEAARPSIAEIPSPDSMPRQAAVPESPPATETLQPLASAPATIPGAKPQAPPAPEPAPAPDAVPEPQPELAEKTPDPQVAEASQPDAPISVAPQEARLPVARPAREAAAAPASRETQQAAAEPEPETKPERKPDPKPAETPAQADPKPAAPAGGSTSRFAAQMTRGEKDALTLGIREFFVYNGSRADRALAVTLAIRLDPRGAIVEGPALVAGAGADPAAQKALFEAGRRALKRAELAGEFRKLPVDKHPSWQLIHVTFTPEDIGFSS